MGINVPEFQQQALQLHADLFIKQLLTAEYTLLIDRPNIELAIMRIAAGEVNNNSGLSVEELRRIYRLHKFAV